MQSPAIGPVTVLPEAVLFSFVLSNPALVARLPKNHS
jgi:hypothetical protein